MQADEARSKNIVEYNDTADKYNSWQSTNLFMQNVCYFTCFKKLEQLGIPGKSFLEVGCGPCPIGKRLAQEGAAKIFGLDISQEMIEQARINLTDLGIIDKFELVCFDIFDEKF